MHKGWKDFCDHFKIPYTDRRDDIEVHCGFCGTGDRGRHLGLSKDGPLWGCWRNEQHRGTNPTKVIRMLLRIEWDEAEVLSNQFFGYIGRSGARVDRTSSHAPINPPGEFKVFEDTPGNQQKIFEAYLTRRGLDADFTSSRYDLRWCVNHVWITDRDVDYSNRIIIPVLQRGDWYTWTGRTISSQQPLRYLAHDVAPADFLFDQDWLKGGDRLIITEGPFDAMKITNCFLPGVHATALFGKVITERQSNMIIKLAALYEKVILAFDRDSYSNSIRQATALGFYIDNIRTMSPDQKDFGSTPIEQLKIELLSTK